MSELWRFGSTPRYKNAKVRVSRLGAKQFGLVSHGQLTSLGIGRGTIARWANGAYLHCVHPGVFAVGHCAPSAEADLAAVLLYAGPGAMLSHATAAWWLGLADRTARRIEVSTPRRCRSLPSARVHDRRAPERIWHKGLPVTLAAQTLLDFASVAPPDRVRRALAEAEFRGLDIAAVEALLGRGRRGSAVLRRALTSHQPRLALTRSVLEERFFALCESAGFPLPEVNATVEGLMVDCLWRAPCVIVELDGYAAHSSHAQIERDRQRDLRLRNAAFVVIRYTWKQITTEGALVAADLGAALGLDSSLSRSGTLA